jgi:hypothetical protein
MNRAVTYRMTSHVSNLRSPTPPNEVPDTLRAAATLINVTQVAVFAVSYLWLRACSEDGYPTPAVPHES